MPILNAELNVWEIGFRWNGLDPGRWYWRIPLAVRDCFRMMMDAILSQELECITLSPEKWSPEKDAPPEFFIRHYLDDVYACIAGHHYNRKLLRWAMIERSAFESWCERRTIPLPEFWFPPGWSEYQWVDKEPEETNLKELGEKLVRRSPDPKEDEELVGGLRPSQRARIATQQIAISLWKKDPKLTITALVEHEAIQDLGGAKPYTPEVVRRWISAVAPKEVKERRGRPRKENPTE